MQELENKKAALELLQNETNEKLNDYKQQISALQKQIDDYNKPALTPKQLDDIQEAIVDLYDIELEMDYDGRVSAHSINMNETYDLVERIVSRVHDLFKEAESTEENKDA
jgi:multidrug resistance efflux pump